MKKSLFTAAGLIGALSFGCNSDHNVQPNLQLVSVDKFKISDSFEDFEKEARSLMKEKDQIDNTITITKIDYERPKSSFDNSFAATVHYKTTTGQKGQFEVYGGGPEATN
jgi:hypothetical protein